MTREEAEALIPPIPHSDVIKGMERAKKLAEVYVSRVRPFYPEGYDNGTSEAVYKHLVEISDRKEAKLKAKRQRQ